MVGGVEGVGERREQGKGRVKQARTEARSRGKRVRGEVKSELIAR